MNAVAEQKHEGEIARIDNGDAMVSMIERAARDPNVDIDKMERLWTMRERIVAQAAKTAFAAAFARMQGDLPEIEERGKGHGNIRYALWEDINEAIKPALQAHGFGLSFKTGRADDKIAVTGILTHCEGHSEETTIELPADNSGSKNAVQSVGSSTTYGKRYTATALLNLTSRLPEDRDDDGRAAGRGETISDTQAKTIRDLVEATKTDIEAFCRYLNIDSIPEMPASKFDRAMAALNKKKGANNV